MKRCSLCKSMAAIYCESDRASLCWTCDAKVHSANFLVARHSRSLLCQLCQSPTPWTASGEKLPPATTARCGSCYLEVISVQDETVGGNTSETDNAEEIENQGGVRQSSATPIPPAASSSGSEDSLSVSLKRKYRMPETAAFQSRESSLVGDMKKVRDPKLISGAYVHVALFRGAKSKSRRTLKFDLNLSPSE